MNIILFGMEYLSPVITKNKQPSSMNRIMLSIAYGGDQSDSLQVHNPEVINYGFVS